VDTESPVTDASPGGWYDATRPPAGWTEEEASIRMPVPEGPRQRAPMCRCSLVPLTATAREQGNVSMEDLAQSFSAVKTASPAFEED